MQGRDVTGRLLHFFGRTFASHRIFPDAVDNFRNTDMSHVDALGAIISPASRFLMRPARPYASAKFEAELVADTLVAVLNRLASSCSVYSLRSAYILCRPLDA